MTKLSQKQIIENLLKDNLNKWLPVHYFVGEKISRGKYEFLSYKAPARLSDLRNEGKVERRMVVGKSGAQYYEYRWKLDLRQESIF